MLDGKITQFSVRIQGIGTYLIGFYEDERVWRDLGEFAGTPGKELARHVADLLNLETSGSQPA